MYHVPGAVGLSRAEQRQLKVEKLRLEGLSTRGIAEELGVSHVTIIRDLRAIEERAGEPLPVEYVGGQDGKWYLPKATTQEYEEEPGFGEGTVEEEALSSADHLTNALADLQRAEDALQLGGLRNPEVPPILADIRQIATRVLSINKALPRPPKES
jgi:predicted DNA-binding transcriptional regulator YafY